MYGCEMKTKVLLKRKLMAALFSGIFLLCLLLGQQFAYANGEIMPLVETEWLAGHLQKPGLAIVYVGGPTSKIENFNVKHVPNAVFFSFFDMLGILGDGSAPPDKAKFEALVGGLGISNDSHVVIYSADTLFASGVFWLFDYFGHEKLSMLNGTVTKWMDEGRPTAGDPSKISPVKYTAQPDATLLATADHVLKNLNNPKTVIVDTRGSDEYNGKYADENKMGNKRVGHIPGALDLGFYQSNLKSDGTFKSATDLKSTYEGKGVTKDKEVITYCQGGVRAAHTYFVLKYMLGYPDVKNYVGSWGEWSTRLDPTTYPVEN